MAVILIDVVCFRILDRNRFVGRTIENIRSPKFGNKRILRNVGSQHADCDVVEQVLDSWCKGLVST